ncbi:MAG: DUF805 domain-containing protein [Elusimicrobia bacterium HGW-Elusimicrobia-3]|jgi:uncharacterized membrane protein YhaH (DUF805 family)|nr:MAG: DUF805 domain-containing protein [Elusimicrobia bacterium HGW-Elusimicrobia-3]
MDQYLAVLNKYAVFSGRAGRREYWMFLLFNLIFSIAARFVDMTSGSEAILMGMRPVSLAYGLAVALPSLAVGVRRLHDIGYAGWWMLLLIVPFLGPVALLVMFCLAGDPGENKYGPAPAASAPEMKAAEASQPEPPQQS